MTTLAGWVACIADARPLAGYADVLTTAGRRAVHTESHDDAIEARVTLLRMTATARLAEAGIDVDAALRYTARAAGAG